MKRIILALGLLIPTLAHAERCVDPGATSQCFDVFIQDTSSTTGAGLTGLAYNSGSLTAYYHRDTASSATSITTASSTLGTYTSGAFKEVSSTNAPGIYQFCPPDAAFASGAKEVSFMLKGATNMAQTPLKVLIGCPADATYWKGTALASTDTSGYPKVTVKSGTGTGEISLSSGRANADTVYWNGSAVASPDTAGHPKVTIKDGTGTGEIDTASGKVSIAPDGIGADAFAPDGTAQAGASSTITLAAAESYGDGVLAGRVVCLVAGTGKGQCRYISTNVLSTDVVTVGENWTTNPDNTSKYVIGGLNKLGDLSTTAKAAVNTEADTALSDYGALKPTVAGRTLDVASGGEAGVDLSNVNGQLGGSEIEKTGYSLSSPQTFDLTGNVTGNLSGSVGSVTGAVGSVTGNVGGNVTGSVGSVIGAVGSVTGNVGGNVVGSVGSVTGAVGSVTGNVGGNVTGSIGSLGATAKSDVNAEMVDVVNVDTYGELTSCPTATASITTILRYLLMIARNRIEQTSSAQALKRDDGSTNLCAFSVSDDGTTFVRGEGS